MKKNIAFLILLLCVKQSYAQYPLKQYLGSDSTLVTVRGGINARVVLWSFTDTTQANTQRISQYAGALIYTTVLDKVWYRNSTATGWIEFTSSGGTTTNIYNSDGFITGTRVLDLSASPLTFSRSGVKQFAAEDNLTTIGSPNNQKRITVYNDSITILGLSQTTDTTTYKPLAIDGNGYFTIMDRWPGGGSGSTPTLQQVFSAEGNEAVITSSVDISPSTTGISFLMGNNGLWHDIIMQSSNQFNLSSNAVSLSAGNNNLLNIGSDSIKIGAYLGRLVIDTLNYTLSTTGKKILIRDTATGLVQNIDPSLLGGGSTPTLQQVLTAGSTLTTDHTIDFGGNDFIFMGDSLVLKDTVGQERIIFETGSGSGGGTPSKIYLTNPEGARMVIQSGDLYLETNSGWYVRNTLEYGNAALSVNTYSGQYAPIIEAVHNSEKILDISVDSFSFRPPLGVLTIDTINYTLSTTGKKILIRDTATGLVQNIDPSLLGASSYTFTNGLTDSSGTVKLGGTLTEHTTIEIGSNTFLIDNGSQYLLQMGAGGPTRLNAPTASTGIEITDAVTQISGDDSVVITQSAGDIRLKNLTSAVGTKALRYNPTTGLVSYADTTTGGSGGTPAGNNRNIQFNSNGAFAGNDSLKFEGGFLKTSNNVPLQIGGVNVINYDNNTNVTTVGGSAYITTISSGGYTVFGTNSKGAIDHSNGALTLGANIGDSLFTNNGSSHQVGNARFDARVNVARASGYATNINGSLGANDFVTKNYVDSTRSLESTYTPSLTNTTNIAASTAYTTYYQRVGDVVHVWGEVEIDATTALTLTELGMELPIASNITNSLELAGTAAHEDNTVAQVKGDPTNDRAKFRLTPQTNTANVYSFHFSYKYVAP